ncbi:MAG: hypothetical protein ACK5T0_01950 [Vampirovibrionales bacterium]
MKVQTRMSSLSPSSSQRSGHIYINVRKQSGDITTKLFTTKKEIDKALENGSLAKFLPKWLAVPTGQKSQGQHMQQFIKATKGFIENEEWHLVIHPGNEAPQARIQTNMDERRAKLSVNHQFEFLSHDRATVPLAEIQEDIFKQMAQFRKDSEPPTLNPVDHYKIVTRPGISEKDGKLVSDFVPPQGSKKQNKKKRIQDRRILIPSIEDVRQLLEENFLLDLNTKIK